MDFFSPPYQLNRTKRGWIPKKKTTPRPRTTNSLPFWPKNKKKKKVRFKFCRFDSSSPFCARFFRVLTVMAAWQAGRETRGRKILLPTKREREEWRRTEIRFFSFFLSASGKPMVVVQNFRFGGDFQNFMCSGPPFVSCYWNRYHQAHIFPWKKRRKRKISILMASVQRIRFSRIQPTFSPFFSHKSEIEIWTDLFLSLVHRVKVRCNDCIWEKRDMQMKVFRFERNRICQSAMRTEKNAFSPQTILPHLRAVF